MDYHKDCMETFEWHTHGEKVWKDARREVFKFASQSLLYWIDKIMRRSFEEGYRIAEERTKQAAMEEACLRVWGREDGPDIETARRRLVARIRGMKSGDEWGDSSNDDSAIDYLIAAAQEEIRTKLFKKEE